MTSSPTKSPYSSKFQMDTSPRQIHKQVSKSSSREGGGKNHENAHVFSTNILQARDRFSHNQKKSFSTNDKGKNPSNIAQLRG